VVVAEDSGEEGIDEKRITCAQQPFAGEEHKTPRVRRWKYSPVDICRWRAALLRLIVNLSRLCASFKMNVMKIIDDLLSTLNYDAPVRGICQGAFQTAVQTRCCGLASTPHDAGPHHVRKPVQEAGSLKEKTARDLAGMAKSESLFEAAIGMATINALLEIDEDTCLNLKAREIITEKGSGKKVAIVGHFPFIPEPPEVVKGLWVIDPDLAMRCVSQGATYRQIKGIRQLTMMK
jgi:hypothetical protein